MNKALFMIVLVSCYSALSLAQNTPAATPAVQTWTPNSKFMSLQAALVSGSGVNTPLENKQDKAKCDDNKLYVIGYDMTTPSAPKLAILPMSLAPNLAADSKVDDLISAEVTTVKTQMDTDVSSLGELVSTSLLCFGNTLYLEVEYQKAASTTPTTGGATTNPTTGGTTTNPTTGGTTTNPTTGGTTTNPTTGGTTTNPTTGGTTTNPTPASARLLQATSSTTSTTTSTTTPTTTSTPTTSIKVYKIKDVGAPAASSSSSSSNGLAIFTLIVALLSIILGAFLFWRTTSLKAQN